MRVSIVVLFAASFTNALFAQAPRGSNHSPQLASPVRAFPRSNAPAPLPPGVGLNGLRPGQSNPIGLNGLPITNQRNVQPAPIRRGNSFDRGNRRNSGYVPLVGGYVFPPVGYTDSYFDDSVQQPALADPNSVVLNEQIYQLKNEVDDLKRQQQSAGTSPPAPSPLMPVVPQEPEIQQPAEPSTVVVLTNGRRVETTNYAVMGRTFWNFSAKPVQKIPLSSIDLAASERLNTERGVDFSSVLNAR